MEFQPLEFKGGSTYSVVLDDHCLVVCVGKSGKFKTKRWLSQKMVKWIAENMQHIDFEKNEWMANGDSIFISTDRME